MKQIKDYIDSRYILYENHYPLIKSLSTAQVMHNVIYFTGSTSCTGAKVIHTEPHVLYKG